MRLIIFFSSIILMSQSCNIEESQLSGSWQALQFYENGQSSKAPLNEVKLTFSPNNRYQFQSIGLYSESGKWRCASNYLILKDTTANPPTERMLKVLYQSSDSLKIRMDLNGAEQVLFLGKIK
jgi:hypothetical protein